MIPGIISPSSPTPHTHPAVPFLPTSRSSSGHGRVLTRASSAEVQQGYVTATGLSLWKRGEKRSSNCRAGIREGKSGSQRKGLGMGMQGTPGRKKKRSNARSKSIGFESTPRTTVTALGNVHLRSGSSSIAISSLGDIDDTTLPSFVHPPGLPTPTVSEIDSNPFNTDVFGTTIYIPNSLSGNLTLRQVEVDGVDTLFPAHNDISVPVNFQSSESGTVGGFDGVSASASSQSASSRSFSGTSLRRKPNTSRNLARSTLHTEDPRSRAADDHSLTHEVFILPLNDDTLGRSALSFSHSAATRQGSKFVSVKLGSSVKARASTPYRLRLGGISHLSNGTAQSKDDLSIELESKSHTNQRHSSGAIDEIFRTGDVELAGHIVGSPSYEKAALSDSNDEQDLASRIETSRHIEPVPSVLEAVCQSSTEHSIRHSWGRIPVDLGGQMEFTEGLESMAVEPLSHPSDTLSSVLSSPLSFSPAPTLSFSPTPAIESPAAPVGSLPVNPQAVSSFKVKRDVMTRDRQARLATWKGAKVMARMMNPTLPEEKEDGVDVVSTEFEEISTREPKKKGSSGETDRISEEQRQARQRRIEHYHDIEKNYSLHVELVLW